MLISLDKLIWVLVWPSSGYGSELALRLTRHREAVPLCHVYSALWKDEDLGIQQVQPLQLIGRLSSHPHGAGTAAKDESQTCRVILMQSSTEHLGFPPVFKKYVFIHFQERRRGEKRAKERETST